MQSIEVVIKGLEASGKTVLMNVIGNALLAHGYQVDLRDEFDNRPAQHDTLRVPGGQHFVGDGEARHVTVRTNVAEPRPLVDDLHQTV